ncbi:MAG: methenyltetrahydromethanopterin cyclohydrolase [Halobacteriales archaeon SW_8_66_22]|nr:MAG: methenyltetrahydromethanopterin cyclohydrolase [Halobacteriales archaeon SW_8_66_22]
MESLNRMATELVDEAIDFAPELGIEIHSLQGDAAVLDFGVERPGAVEAGLLLAEIQTAGLATVQTRMDEVAATPRTHGGWELSTEGFEGLGSGPARALVAEEEIFQVIGYRDEFDFAVLALEAERLPDEEVAATVAERAGVPESGVFLPTFSTASVTGSVVAAARAAELAAFRLHELGYDPLDILSATGSAPVPPVAGDEETAIARTTDAVAFGGQVHLVVDEPFDRFDEVVSTAREEYDSSFETIFGDVDWDFSELPVGLFGPAQVTVDVRGGETNTLGALAPGRLAESFGL